MRSILKKILYPVDELINRPSQAEQLSCKSLASFLKADIIFDSRRTNFFAIYVLSLENLSTIQLISHPTKHCQYPDVSPNGNVVYALTNSLDRNAESEIWIKSKDSEPRFLVNKGTFPTFNSTGEIVYFERGRKELWSILVTGEKEQMIFSGNHKFPNNNSFGSYAVVKPRVSPDGQRVIFTSDKGGRWNLWCVNLSDGSYKHIIKGCEAAWFPDSKTTAWVKKYGWLDKVGIYGIDVTTNAESYCLQDQDFDFGHEYFPYITIDGNYLLYSACPIYQHDHNSANYQLFCKNLMTQDVVRLTFDGYTNRWPKVLSL